MANYQLYARILRLWHLDDHPSFRGDKEMRRIVGEVVYPDRSLVWC